MSTNKQRTKESMLAFADGLLGTRSVTPIEPPNKDMLLRVRSLGSLMQEVIMYFFNPKPQTGVFHTRNLLYFL